MSYISSYDFFLIPPRVLQNGLDDEIDAWAKKFKLSLDDATPYFREGSLSRVEILPPKKPLARYDAPWQANEVVPRNDHCRWEYEIGSEIGITNATIGNLQFERDTLYLRVRFSTPLKIGKEHFNDILRKYAEQLKRQLPQ